MGYDQGRLDELPCFRIEVEKAEMELNAEQAHVSDGALALLPMLARISLLARSSPPSCSGTE